MCHDCCGSRRDRTSGHLAHVLIGIDASTQTGLYQDTSPDLQRLTGKPPTTVEQFLAEHLYAFKKRSTRR